MSIQLDYTYANQLSGRLEHFKWIRPMLAVCRCPICGDSTKKKSKRRFYIYQDVKRGSNHLSVDCKNCGYGNPFGRFLMDYDVGMYEAYRMDKFKESGKGTPRQRRAEKKPAAKPVEVARQQHQVLPGCTPIANLPGTHPAAQYIHRRQIPEPHLGILWYTPNFAQSLDGYSEIPDLNLPGDERVCLPFYDEGGNLIAVQGRSLDAKSSMRYITVKKKDDSSKIYGLDRVNRSRTVLVVEGPFDSLFLPNCIATADADLLRAGFGDIFIPDNQYRNTEICNRIQGLIDAGKSVVLFPASVPYKDINDMVEKGGFTKHELFKLIASRTFKGLAATLEFAKLRKDRKPP